MIEIVWSRLPFEAICLWPVIFYRHLPDKCLRVHERYHWHDALRWGVIPWYVAYLVLGLWHIGKPADKHPLERGAYKAERECRAQTSVT